MADAQLAESVKQVLGQVHQPVRKRVAGAFTLSDVVRWIAQAHVMIPGPDRQRERQLLDCAAVLDGARDRLEGPQPFLRGREALGQLDCCGHITLVGEVSA